MRQVTLTGTYLEPDGDYANIEVRFTPTSTLKNVTENVVLLQQSVAARTNGKGQISVQLYPWQDGMVPNEFLYFVEEFKGSHLVNAWYLRLDEETPDTVTMGAVYPNSAPVTQDEYPTLTEVRAIAADLDGAIYTKVGEVDAKVDDLAAVMVTKVGTQELGLTVPTMVNGQIETKYIPTLQLARSFAAASQEQMLARYDQPLGTICRRTDLGVSFMNEGTDSTNLASWVQISDNFSVTSVQGKSGMVTLSPIDIGAAPTDHEHKYLSGQEYVATLMRGQDLEASRFLRVLTGNGRVEISDQAVRWYDSSGVVIYELNPYIQAPWVNTVVRAVKASDHTILASAGVSAAVRRDNDNVLAVRITAYNITEACYFIFEDPQISGSLLQPIVGQYAVVDNAGLTKATGIVTQSNHQMRAIGWVPSDPLHTLHINGSLAGLYVTGDGVVQIPIDPSDYTAEYALNIGTVDSAVVPAASITGTYPDQTLNLTIPYGPIGPVGPEGPEGPQGPQGLPGKSVNVVSSVPSAANLPTSGQMNDGILTKDDGHLHVWDGDEWVDVGDISGPTGPQGPQGIQGVVGPQGEKGDQGIQGIPGTQGLQGIDGPAGPVGPEGPQGIEGGAGPQGEIGPDGPPGPVGPEGPEGQSLPAGGLTDQVLTKLSPTDGDATWKDGGAPVSGVFGTAPLDIYGADSLRGQETYIDSTGKLRVQPQLIPGANGFNITDSPGLYPPGMSIMGLGATDAARLGWPSSCTVVTFRRATQADTVVAQYYYQNHTPQAGAPLIMYRSGNGSNSPAWSSWITQYGTSTEKPYISIRRSAVAQAIPNSAVTRVDFEIGDYTDGIAWDATAKEFTIPISGYYTVEGTVHFASGGGTGHRTAHIYKNGIQIAAVQSAGASAGGTNAFISRTHWFDADDKVSFYCAQGSGASVNLTTSANYNFFTISKVPTPLPAGAQFGEKNYSSSRSHTVATSIPTSVHTPIPFNTENWTDGISWSTDSFVAPVAGYYQVDASGTLASNATGVRSLSVMLGATYVSTVQYPPTSGASTGMSVSATVKAALGELISVRIYQNSGAALLMAGGPNNNYVSIVKVPAPVVGGNAASAIWGSSPLDKVGSNPDFGTPIYVDSRGQLRSQPQALSTSVYPKTNAMLPGTYPVGMSIVQITGAQATSGGWPEGVSGSVVTFRRSGESDADACASQWYYVTTSGNARAYYRSGSGTGGANQWSPWKLAVPDDTGWIDASLDTDWAHYGSSYGNVGYRRIGNLVTLRGLAKSNIARTGTSTILTLPVGYRPLQTAIFNGLASAAMISGAASTGTAHTHTASYQLPMRVDVTNSSGAVTANAQAGWAIGIGGYVSLEGISFYID